MARVPIGITAANKQAPFLMHLEYRITLPDHDWVVAAKHKLIPSVVEAVVINDGKVGRPATVRTDLPIPAIYACNEFIQNWRSIRGWICNQNVTNTSALGILHKLVKLGEVGNQ